MTKVTIRSLNRQTIDRLARSQGVEDVLSRVAVDVARELRKDPNQEFVDSIQRRRFLRTGRRGRVTIQVGAHPVIGLRVEAKRGVFQRALAVLGLR